MSRLIAERSDGIAVEHFHGFADVEVARNLRPRQRGIWDLDGPGRDELVSVGPNALIVCTEREADAFVRYELWDATPPEYDEEQLWSGPLFLASGRICAVSEVEGEQGYFPVFDLYREMTEWRARLWSTWVDNDRDLRFPRSIYQVHLLTLQLWLPDGFS